MVHLKRLIFILSVFVNALLCFKISASDVAKEIFFKGMTVSCQTWGYEWATPEMCLEIALERVKDQSFIAGLFLWKWFPENGRVGHHEDYNLQRPELKKLIKKLWLGFNFSRY